MCQLFNKRVPVHTTCPLCKGDEETVFHVLVSCPFASQCWRRILQLRYDSSTYSFVEWFTMVLNSQTIYKWSEVAMMCWGIWKSRNEVMWQQKVPQVNTVCFSTMQYFVQWKDAQVSSNIALFPNMHEKDGVSHWVRPQVDTIKVSVDAAIFEDLSAAGFGFVARNSEGVLTFAKTGRLWGSFTPE